MQIIKEKMFTAGVEDSKEKERQEEINNVQFNPNIKL